ncbi:MAG: hypothetical protein ACREFW_07130 [Rhizomicrobium sp.]
MRTRLLLATALGLALSGCALYVPSAGNPNGDAYMGSRASTYEAAINPARTMGEVTYNPAEALPESGQLPSPSDMVLAPIPPPPARPAPR